MSGTEVVGLISAIISIVDAVGKVSKALKDANDLPRAFHEVAERLPLVRDTLRTVESHIRNITDERAHRAIEKVLKNCNEKAAKLDELFKVVAPSEGRPRIKRYALALQRVGKQNRVENLATEMMEDAQLLVLNYAAQAASEAQVSELCDAIEELSKMESSLPDDASINQTHSGSGDNIAGNKYGGSHNEIGGNAYFAPVTQHVVAKKATKLSTSQSCLRSLAFQGMDTRPTEIRTATAGTCRWILSHKTFKQWESHDRSLLWIKGKPGSGKSTLLRFARDNITTPPNTKERPLVLSFFFNGRGTELQKTPEGLFRSLLYQIQSKLPEAMQDLEATFKQREVAFGNHGEHWQWSLSDLRYHFETSLWKALKSHPILLFIDALDECDEENAQQLMEEFSSLLHRPASAQLKEFRVCFTCRHYPVLDLNDALQICVEHENKKDISIFVNGRLSSFSERTDSEIGEYISERAEGVFLWASLVVSTVLSLDRRLIARETIEAEVRRVPPTLHELYSEMTAKMDEAAAELFTYICFAPSPLNLTELRYAITISRDLGLWVPQGSEDKPRLPYNNEGMRWEIQKLGRGLIECKGRNGEVGFIHQSVKDFFVVAGLPLLLGITKPEQVEMDAHHRLLKICLEYLRKVMDKGVPKDVHGGIRHKFPFLDYCVTSWVFHAMHIPDEIQRSFPWPSDRQLEQIVTLEKLNFASDPFAPILTYFSRPSYSTLMQFFAKHGMTGALKGWLERHGTGLRCLNSGHIHESTPLMFAANYGRTSVVETLLAAGAPREGRGCRAPLDLAIERNHLRVLEILLEFPVDNSAERPLEVDYDYTVEPQTRSDWRVPLSFYFKTTLDPILIAISYLISLVYKEFIESQASQYSIADQVSMRAITSMASAASVAGQASMKFIVVMVSATTIGYPVFMKSILFMVSVTFVVCLLHLHVTPFEVSTEAAMTLAYLGFCACKTYTKATMIMAYVTCLISVKYWAIAYFAPEDVITARAYKGLFKTLATFALFVCTAFDISFISFVFQVVIAGQLYQKPVVTPLCLVVIAYEAYKGPAMALADLVSEEKPIVGLLSVILFALRDFLLENRVIDIPGTYKRHLMWRTPLSRAAEIGNERIVHLLLRHGADPNRRDKAGETPLSRAEKYGRDEVVQILCRYLNS